MRMNAIKFTTRDGKQMETTSSKDTEEIDNERILQEPIIHDTEVLDPQHVSQGMKKEVQQMKDQSVFTKIDGSTMTPEQRANIIESRWVLKPKRNEALAKGYTKPVTDHDLLFASTPLFCMLTVLLTMSLVYIWSVCTGDVSVAFLHAPAISYNLVVRPPKEFYNKANRVRAEQSHLRLKKTMASPHSETHNREQCLQAKGLPGLHHDLCGRPPNSWEYRASSTHCSAKCRKKHC